jgi:hypothetical protein
MNQRIIIHAPHLTKRPSIAVAAVRPPQPQPLPRPPLPEEPTRIEMAANFSVAMGRWAAAGFPTVSAEEYALRNMACEHSGPEGTACEYWDGDARWGLGKCKAPGCGCTRFKRWLATERCRHPKGSRWPENRPISAIETKTPS